MTYFAEVKTGVTWTSRTSVLVEQGGAGHYCSAGEGDAWLVASAAGFELGRSFTVYPTGRISSIAATSLSSNPVVPQVVGSQSVLCPAERFSAKFADATEKDVTTSPAADWSLGPANGAPMYFRARDADGTTIQDLAGNPCFVNAYLVTQPATFNGTFWYAGQPATFSFQFQPQ